jgi:hypothetical protein
MNNRYVVGVLAAGFMAWSIGSASAQEATGSDAKAVQVAPVQLTAGQKAEAQQRMVFAKSIIARLESEANQMGLAAEWKQATLNILLSNSSSRLAQIARIGGYQATISAATTGKGLAVEPKAFGSTTDDLIFKPWTPCRYVDTRVVGGKIAGTRGYDLSLNGASYGGVAGCDPTTLAGVGENSFGGMAMNITIVDTSTAGVPGFLAARPAGSAGLTSLVNWYVAGATVSDANAAIVAMDQTIGADEFELVTSGPVHAVVDLFGAFIAPNPTPLQCVNTAESSTLVAAGASFSLDPPACPAGYSQVSARCRAEFFNTFNWATIGSSLGAGSDCQGTNTSGVAHNGYAMATCCRVPGR